MTMTTVSIQQKPKEPLWTQRFIILNFSFMSLSCGFQMLLPTLPLHASTLTHQTLILGLLVSILSASAALIRPFVGARLQNSWPDRMNLLGLAICLAATCGYFVESTVGLLVMRLLHGIGWGISTTAYGTMAAVLIPAAHRGDGMSGWGFGAVVTVSAALTLLALLLAPLVGTPSRRPVVLSSDEMTGEAGWRRWLEPVTLKPAALHALLGFSYGGDFTTKTRT